MLKAKNLCITIAGRTIFHGIDLLLPTGSSLAIVGVSGSGKTTLLNALSLILPYDSGSLQIAGQDYSSVTDRQRRQFWASKAAFVLQDYGLIDEETAAYNTMLSRPPFRKRSAISNARVLTALGAVGMADRAGDYVASLSGGEKQRVSIARALFKDAEYLFAGTYRISRFREPGEGI